MRKTIGETRIREGFLFLPMHIYGDWRWLERATWKEQVNDDFHWIPVEWINE